MSISVAVAGGTGYAGAEILRLLSAHPDARIQTVTAGANAGARLGDLQPHLAPLADVVVAETTPETLAGHDVVFLALPHGASAEIARRLPPDALVLDCGADHRLADPDEWSRHYDGPWPGAWPYGLPELPGRRAELVGARRIAVPGCYPTAVALALTPAVSAGLADAGDVVVVAASGVSGAGKAPKPHLLGAELMGAASAYAVGGGHRHLAEMRQNLRAAGAEEPQVSFTPVLAPMSRGILAVCSAPSDADPHQLAQAYQVYDDEPFVQLLPEGRWPNTSAVLGANAAQVAATIDQRAGRLVAVAAIDNLTKGTAGPAVQCMNIALGLPEGLGLTTIGVAP